MADTTGNSLTAKTPIFGLKLYLLIGICAGFLVVIVIITFFYLRSDRRRRMRVQLSIPSMSKEIVEIKNSDQRNNSLLGDILRKEKEIERAAVAKVVMDVGTRSSESHTSSGESKRSSSFDIPNIGWGRWYTLRELEIATGGFAKRSVIGEGGYGIVYRGVMPDCSVIAVKSLINKKGQAEKEFKVEVEAIGKVRHKNLVGLIGYCAEGSQRILVYEYVDNGNLEQWLHGDVGPVSPLSWDIRMKIAIGTARGIAHLHEGLDPKVVHRDIKSSNILLDKKWDPRVSDFGLAKLLGSDTSYVTTRVMGTFGCVAPEYASTGMLTEGSDVYSFGVLLMEIISGRSPVDYARPPGEVNLVDWFKGMVANRRGEEIVDPLIEIHPSSRALKRALLVCLRCIDLDANKRPKMGQVVHMLEGDDFPFRGENNSPRGTASLSPHAGRTVIERIPFPSKLGGSR